MRRWIGMASLVLLASMMMYLTSMMVCRGNQSPAVQGEDSRRHAESGGGFSFIAPAGWRSQAFPGLSTKSQSVRRWLASPRTSMLLMNISLDRLIAMSKITLPTYGACFRSSVS